MSEEQRSLLGTVGDDAVAEFFRKIKEEKEDIKQWFGKK